MLLQEFFGIGVIRDFDFIGHLKRDLLTLGSFEQPAVNSVIPGIREVHYVIVGELVDITPVKPEFLSGMLLNILIIIAFHVF